MLAWDYYIIKESKNRFKDWTQAGLEHLRKEYKKLQNKKERNRIKKILDDEDDNDPEFKTWKVRRKQAKCYTGDTEILTETGWQRLDSYDGITKVAQYDFQSEQISRLDPRRLRLRFHTFSLSRKTGSVTMAEAA